MIPKKRFWFYRPTLYWYGWKSLRPFWFGNDEYHRKTLVLGWNPTGQIIIALWRFRNCTEECGPFCDVCGMGMWRGPEGWYCPDCDREDFDD